MKKYTKNLAFLDLVIIAFLVTMKSVFKELFLYNEIALLGLLIPVHTAFNHYQLNKTLEKNPKKFSNTFLLLTFTKLFTYLTFAVVVAFIFPLRAKGFIITEAIFYFAFLVYETRTLSQLVKPKN